MEVFTANPLLLLAAVLLVGLIILSILKKLVKMALIAVSILLLLGGVAALKKPEKKKPMAEIQQAAPAPRPAGGMQDTVKYNERAVDYMKEKARKVNDEIRERMDEASE